MAEVPAAQDVKDDEYAERILGLLEELGGATVETSRLADARPADRAPVTSDYRVRRFDREVDADWRRTSYSGLIRVEETPVEGGVSSEPETVTLEDEPEAVAGEPVAGEPAAGEPGDRPAGSPLSPMADLPAGATFGSLVHAVLEHADPQAADFRAELRTRTAEQLRWWPVDAGADDLAEALLPLHETPLGPLAPGMTLGRIPLSDRLRELDFEFPLAGGDLRGADRADHRDVLLRDLAPLLRAHLPADDPLAGYADRLEQPALGGQPLRGYLSGSIDVVLRIPAGDDRRYLVVDYKTNLLGEPGRPLTAADYGPAELAEAMLHSHYPLQALLYSVVLHRYLRWRLPGYDPATHLGGILYLYVRGMCGAETPTTEGHPAGVFSWRPPESLVVALSDLLDGADTEAGGHR
jgi:exodeoxyribonuclease V beta subunit